MPEGDSVHRLAARLRRAADGRTVADGELRSGDAAGSSLEGLRILEHDTHGKHLLTRFSGDLTLHTHLRMQGSWTVTSPGRAVPRAVQKDVRVRLRLDDGVTLWGVDLPVVELLPTRDEARAVGHLGPDPLRTDWSAEEAVARLSRTPERPVVAALLDQRLMAGLGNLWANEICFLRGLFPWRPVGTVDVPRPGRHRRPGPARVRHGARDVPDHHRRHPPRRAALGRGPRRPAVPALRHHGPRPRRGPRRPGAAAHLVVPALPARAPLRRAVPSTARLRRLGATSGGVS